MSFISVLKKIGQVAIGIEHVAAPVVSSLIPGAAPIIGALDNLFTRVQTTIQTVELTSPVGGGQLKAAVVVTDFEAGLETTQAVLALTGKHLEYDAALLQDAINNQVAAYNSFAKLKGSFKVVDLK